MIQTHKVNSLLKRNKTMILRVVKKIKSTLSLLMNWLKKCTNELRLSAFRMACSLHPPLEIVLAITCLVSVLFNWLPNQSLS